ncbi:MAG: RDD family protein [Candidatus Hodarchaeaceae archaeon]|nr:RDD family protein [Candidatus Hodarchaeaceae archaeon]
MIDVHERMLIELVMAKPWKRLLAWVMDQAILSAIVALPAFFLLKEAYPYEKTVQVLLLISLIYFTALEGAFGQTIGKHALNIKVYGEGGARVGFARALLRRVGLVTVLGIFDAAAVLATPRRQRLFDIVASTVVIDNARASEAAAYLRGSDVRELLVKSGAALRVPTEEARLRATLERMRRMLAELGARRERGELSREEYTQLREKYGARILQLEAKLREKSVGE